MDWDKLDIHVENFAPGLATVWALSLLWPALAIDSDASKVVLGISLLGAAYLIGVIVNVLCRVLLDPLSEHWTRVYVFKVFSKDKLRDMQGATRQEVNSAYNYYCSKAIAEAKQTAKEVARRRRTGRLLRSTLVPIILVQLHFSISVKMGILAICILMTIEYLLLLLLYGYAEAAVLHEAYFAVPEKERSVSVIKKILDDKQAETEKAEPCA